MTAAELKSILDKHRLWLEDKPGGERANLTGASLRGADLIGADLAGADLTVADLTGAYLTGANLIGADLAGADLTGANLTGANLTRANLTRADLTGAYLTGANLIGADLAGAALTGTCLNPASPLPALTDEAIRAVGLEPDGERVWGWRTATSQHCGSTEYKPRAESYDAPWFSVDAGTDCHPGIYISNRKWLEGEYAGVPLVRCYCRRDELLLIAAKGGGRCKRLWVTGDDKGPRKAEKKGA